jgi:hypothetical protein
VGIHRRYRDGDEFVAAMGELDDAVRAFLALALTSVGRKREAVSIALTAPAAHLPRYTARSRATRASWPERSRRPAPAP